MKMLKLLVVALATMGSASAALYTVQTGTGAAINGFASSGGVAFQATSGSMSFGYFTISDVQIGTTATAAELLASFVSFAGPGNFAVAGPIGQKGAVSVAGSGTVAGSGFDGKSIYALVGNASTLVGATEFAVLKTTSFFAGAQDLIPTPAVITLNTSGSLLKGSPLADLKTTTTDSSVNPGFATSGFAPIPEPSAALLGAVGALALLRRRRI